MAQEVHVQGRSKCQNSGELLVSNTGQVAEKSFFLFFFLLFASVVSVVGKQQE